MLPSATSITRCCPTATVSWGSYAFLSSVVMYSCLFVLTIGIKTMPYEPCKSVVVGSPLVADYSYGSNAEHLVAFVTWPEDGPEAKGGA